jgi:uncharacterized protein YutE (UPF0331/DUF86 family)
MTPRPLNADTIVRRLQRLDEVLDLLRSLGTPTAKDLGSLGVRAQVEWAVERLVELAVNINLHAVAAAGERPPADYAESFRAATEVGLLPEDLARELSPAVGLRNVVVHEYLDVDLERVAASVPRAIDAFTAYRRVVAARLPDFERELTTKTGADSTEELQHGTSPDG